MPRPSRSRLRLARGAALLGGGGRQIIVERSGHGIPDEAPEAVIAAAREVVEAVWGAGRAAR